MFKILYIYLYRYTSFISLVNYYSLPKPNFNHKSNHIHFNLSNIDYSNLFKFRKKHILFLKKKFFFFRFLNRPINLYKKLIWHGYSSTNPLKKNSKSVNSIRSKLIKRCFKKIRGKRPIRNLYYKISRSRPLIRGAFPQIKRVDCLSDFLKNSENINFTNYGNICNNKNSFDIVVNFKNPLLYNNRYCTDLQDSNVFLDKIRVRGLLSGGVDKKDSRFKKYSNRLPKKIRKKRRKIKTLEKILKRKKKVVARFSKTRFKRFMMVKLVRVTKVVKTKVAGTEDVVKTRKFVSYKEVKSLITKIPLRLTPLPPLPNSRYNKRKPRKKFKKFNRNKFKKRRKFVKFTRFTKRRFGRNIPFFWYLFRANVFNRLIKLFKIRKIFLTYFF